MEYPATRRAFGHEWDEIVYLGTKLEYWLHHEGSRRNSRCYVERLRALLARHDAKQEAIKGQEYRALIHEFTGDIRSAIRHRLKELTLIEKLHSFKDLPRWARKPKRVILEKKQALRLLQSRLERSSRK
jgi:hypothetical protein